jgi:hypothetical protein
MEMFLMVVCMSLFGLGVTAAAFGAATRPERSAAEPQPALAPRAEWEDEPVMSFASARFFEADRPSSPAPQPQVPVEVLLMQIDSHVRLEQAAAESFLEYPSAALLHSRTASPLFH